MNNQEKPNVRVSWNTNFTMIPNNILRNEEGHFKLPHIGLLCYLLSHDLTRFILKQDSIASHLNMPASQVVRVFQDLIKMRYIHVTFYIEKGHKKRSYLIFDHPYSKEDCERFGILYEEDEVLFSKLRKTNLTKNTSNSIKIPHTKNQLGNSKLEKHTSLEEKERKLKKNKEEVLLKEKEALKFLVEKAPFEVDLEKATIQIKKRGSVTIGFLEKALTEFRYLFEKTKPTEKASKIDSKELSSEKQPNTSKQKESPLESKIDPLNKEQRKEYVEKMFREHAIPPENQKLFKWADLDKLEEVNRKYIDAMFGKYQDKWFEEAKVYKSNFKRIASDKQKKQVYDLIMGIFKNESKSRIAMVEFIEDYERKLYDFTSDCLKMFLTKNYRVNFGS